MRSCVRDVMTAPVFTSGPLTPFKEIVSILDRKRVSALPVVDAAGCIVGIVSEGDLITREQFPRSNDGGTHAGTPAPSERYKSEGTIAAQLMTAPAVTVTPEASLRTAATLMRDRGVKRLPVVDHASRVIGIVSRADLLKVFLRSDHEILADIRRDVMDGALWLGSDSIAVEVRAGEVTLAGSMRDERLVDRLVGLVYGVDGVIEVHRFIAIGT